MITTLPTGHVGIEYINENSLVLNTFESYFYNDFFRVYYSKRDFIMNNKQKSNKNYRCKMSKKRLKIRTKEEFISELRRLSKLNKKYLNYSYLRELKRHDLLVEAVKYFGGWREAVKAAGFRPVQKGWTKEEIISEIKRIVYEIGYIPKSKEVIKLGYIGLSTAARRRFGGWTNALVEAGFKPFRKNWTKEEAVKQLKETYKEIGYSPSMRKLKNLKRHDLLGAGLKFFEKYNDFLKAADLPIVLDMNKWPKNKIIKELQKIQEELGRTPRRSELAIMKRYDLINAAEKYFSCWSEALITAGLVPNSDVLNDDKTWREWEDLIFEFLLRKKIVYKKKKYIKKVGYPDIYIPSQNKIIEIKINCSDNSVKKDIEKYIPYCEKLEIWYLFGKPFGVLFNKISFIGPNRIKDMIKHEKDLLNKFHKIKNKEVNKCDRENKKNNHPW